LEAATCEEAEGEFYHQALKGRLLNEQIGFGLVFTDLPKHLDAGTVPNSWTA
jgi:hypothetical protein